MLLLSCLLCVQLLEVKTMKVWSSWWPNLTLFSKPNEAKIEKKWSYFSFLCVSAWALSELRTAQVL